MNNYISIFSMALVVLSILSTSTMYAQCPDQEGENKLDGQVEVDEFLANNPNCTYIYELDLSGDITDVSGFSSLTSVSYLYINDCPNLTDISGFSNIDSIYRNLGFYNTKGLTNLCGFHNLVFIGRDLRFEGTFSIENLDGLENLNFIGDDIEIEENAKLENLNALQNASLVAGSYIDIIDNPLLTNCCGIQHLINNNIDIDLSIQKSPSLCSSIEEVVNVDCNFPTSSCTTNTDEELTFDIQVYPNPAKNFLKIDNFESVRIDQLVIYDALGQKNFQIAEPSISIPIHFLKSGLYLVELRIDNARIMNKIIVQD